MPKKFTPMLVPLRAPAVVNPVASFDCETFGEDNIFQIAVVSTKTKDYLFTNPTECLDFLCRREFWNHNVYATNLVFDAFALFQASTAPGRMPPGWSFFDNGSKLIFVKKVVSQEIRPETGTQKFKYQTLLDSLNIFPAGVEEMGKILERVSKDAEKVEDWIRADYFSEVKLEKPRWLGKRRWDDLSEQNRNLLVTYCAADARVTRKFMEWFTEEVNNLGAELKITAASTSLDLFRRRYMSQDNTCIPQPSWECMVESKLSYYGGRTEAFCIGTASEVYEADVTAMYPASMTEIEFPYPSPEHFQKWESPPESCLEREGFAKVTIQVPYMDIPPLPYRTADKLLFPYGELQGVWTHLELRYALELGCVISDIEWSYFNSKTFNPFRSYVNDLFHKRLDYLCKPRCSKFLNGEKCEHSMVTEEVIKLFLNGLYGKFGQNFLTQEQADALKINIKPGGGTYKTFDDATPEEILFTGEHYPHLLARGYVLNKAMPKVKQFMNPILSSYTTARARVKLHQFIMRAQSEGALVLYTDTDSLYYVKKDGPLSFVTKQKTLGLLQHGKLYDSMTIVGPKAKLLKRQDGKVVYTLKGVPPKSFRTDYEKIRPEMSDEELDALTVELNPRKETFDSLANDSFESPTYSQFLKFKAAMGSEGTKPNQIRRTSKAFEPFNDPKRRILGNPSKRDLPSKLFQTVPWEIDGKTQQVVVA